MEYYGYKDDGDIAKKLDISYLKKDYMTIQLKSLEEAPSQHFTNLNTFKYHVGQHFRLYFGLFIRTFLIFGSLGNDWLRAAASLYLLMSWANVEMKDLDQIAAVVIFDAALALGILFRAFVSWVAEFVSYDEEENPRPKVIYFLSCVLHAVCVVILIANSVVAYFWNKKSLFLADLVVVLLAHVALQI